MAYYPANPCAGYSGFVIQFNSMGVAISYWMVPGTFFDDWDNW